MIAAGLIAAATVAAPDAQAQSVSDFRLPPATTAPRPVGPIDSDHPDVAASPAVPTSAASPAAPTSAAPPPVITLPQPAPTPTPPHAPIPPRPGPEPTAAARPAPTRSPTPHAAAISAPPVPRTPAPVLPSSAPPAESVPATPAPQPPAVPAWWWLAAAAFAGALGAAGALLRLARRREARADKPPVPVPPPAAPSPFDLALQPDRLTLSLVNATLHYHLRLTNTAGRALGPVILTADMIAAHAALPRDSQLARDGAPLAPRHQLPGLAPGESVDLSGELRLPLAAILPIRSGSAALLVPLVRLRIESAGLSDTRALVVGEAPARPGGLLRPFRLDQGPRVFSVVERRELAV